MKSRLLLNLILLALTVGITIYIIKNPVNNDNPQRISSLKTQDINKIHISKEKDDITFYKENDVWYISSPYQIKAHDFRINHLLQILEAPVSKTYDSSALNLNTFDFTPPRAHVTFNNTEILFGKTNPVTNQRFLLIDSTMFLVYEEVFALLGTQASTFVDLSLLPDDSRITNLSLPGLELDKVETHWKTTPENLLNADQIQSLLEHWNSAQAFAVHRYLKRKDLGNIEIHFAEKKIIFEISDDEPWLILARPDLGIEYHLDPSLKNKLFGKPDA